MGPDGLVEKDTKTHQARRVALDRDTTRRLAAHRGTVIERAAACGTALPDDAFVFSADVEGREPWYPDSVSRRFRSAPPRPGRRRDRRHDRRRCHRTRTVADDRAVDPRDGLPKRSHPGGVRASRGADLGSRALRCAPELPMNLATVGESVSDRSTRTPAGRGPPRRPRDVTRRRHRARACSVSTNITVDVEWRRPIRTTPARLGTSHSTGNRAHGSPLISLGARPQMVPRPPHAAWGGPAYSR